MNETKERSQAAAQASRTNGARSKGPQSARGKQRSARNSLKHGLFRTGFEDGAALSDSASALARELWYLSDGSWEARTVIENALDAAIRLERAESLVRRIRGEVAALLSSDAASASLLGSRLGELLRYSRYERRLRGRRDRAMRKIMALASARAC